MRGVVHDDAVLRPPPQARLTCGQEVKKVLRMDRGHRVLVTLHRGHRHRVPEVTSQR
ncbi:hypothetical protein DPMN_132425 [Dreissena polymorpha]|uniref:Uncharacterized protein n=1 Tax=Dreissena polymorpha TaxID=45954 RepID=A0A9D4FSF2_DREPO|nr:hypothetical protein DPMN_132425 [Dreissena polymorpha]